MTASNELICLVVLAACLGTGWGNWGGRRGSKRFNDNNNNNNNNNNNEVYSYRLHRYTVHVWHTTCVNFPNIVFVFRYCSVYIPVKSSTVPLARGTVPGTWKHRHRRQQQQQQQRQQPRQKTRKAHRFPVSRNRKQKTCTTMNTYTLS